MAVFTTERTARKPYRCSDCGRPIQPGKRYRSTVITPGGEFGYEGWSRFTSHLSEVDCDYELAAEPLPDAPDWLGGSDWPQEDQEPAPTAAGQQED